MKSLTSLLALVVAASVAPCQESAPHPPPPSTVSFSATIAARDEPGTPLIITGRVFHSDKKTLYAGLILYFYQTDESGVYNKTDGSFLRPRLHGWVKTDKDGRYELRTIKPGSYPRRNESAHIHVTTKGSGTSARWLDEILFEGDPNLSDAERRKMDEMGRFSPVVRLSKDGNGVLHAVRDIILHP